MSKLKLPKGWDDEDLDERVRAITATALGPLLRSPEAIQFLLEAVRATQTEFEQRRSALVHRAEQARQELLAARDASASMEVVDELVRETSVLNADLARKHKGSDLTRQVNQLIDAQKKDRSQQALRKVQQARGAIQARKKGSWLLRLWWRWRHPAHSIDIVLRSVTGARKQLRRDIATAMRSTNGPLASYLGRLARLRFVVASFRELRKEARRGWIAPREVERTLAELVDAEKQLEQIEAMVEQTASCIERGRRLNTVDFDERTLERKELRLAVESSGFHELVSPGSVDPSTLGQLRLAWDNAAEELVQVWAAERWLSTERPDSLELCAMGTRLTTLEAELMWMNGVLRPNKALSDLLAGPFPGEVREPLSAEEKKKLAALELRVSSLRERFPYAF